MTEMKTVAAGVVAVLVLVVAVPATPTDHASVGDWTTLPPADEPQVNPLKGFIPFRGSYTGFNFPYSMEYADFSLNAMMTGPNAFSWTKMETVLNDIAARGHQTVLRFYLDNPAKPSGIPQFLIDDGLVVHTYSDYGNNGQSVSPNYDDSALRTAIAQFVAAFGKQYDGDSRIGFIQVGIVGFWGEWHTYPYNGYDGKPNWMPSDVTQREILNDYTGAFQMTKLMVRNPNTMNALMTIGYHDDSFALDTMTSSTGWHFMDNMVSAAATETWKNFPIGGELRPELQSCIFSSAGCPKVQIGGDYNFSGSVSQTHASWLINQYAFGTGYSLDDRSTALVAAKSLGYSFRATQALVPTAVSATIVTVGMNISNIGVAPFYYDWPITLAYINIEGNIEKSVTTTWRVSDIPSGSSKQFTGSIDMSGVAAGSYNFVSQVKNPLSGGNPVRFANAGQDTVINGWLTLGLSTFTEK